MQIRTVIAGIGHKLTQALDSHSLNTSQNRGNNKTPLHPGSNGRVAVGRVPKLIREKFKINCQSYTPIQFP